MECYRGSVIKTSNTLVKAPVTSLTILVAAGLLERRQDKVR